MVNSLLILAAIAIRGLGVEQRQAPIVCMLLTARLALVWNLFGQ
jgi:hypothetical protein